VTEELIATMSDTPLTTATVDPQVNSHLVQIPLEILIRITYFISTVDLGNVRLSCKALEQSLFNFFSYEFFRKKQFMVTSDSLQALIDIAKHPTLGPCLKHVIVSTERPPLSARSLSDEPRARLELAFADNMHLLAAGGLRDMLVEAFTHLPNLDTIDIRDFNATSRNRDGRGTQWRSYGAVSLERSTNAIVISGPRGAQDLYSTQLFSAVTAALATAQARPRSLEVLVRNPSWAPFALQDAAFYVPPRLEGSMSSLLSSLRSLHLTLSLTRSAGMRPFMFHKFLSLAPNLTWLRLNFSHTNGEDIQDFLRWLALRDSSKATGPLAMQPIQLRHLERLDLGTAETDPETLAGLVAKFAPSLTSLYLRRVCLFNPQNPLGTDRVNPWVRCLAAISRLPGLRLRVIDFSTVTHSCGPWRGAVSFKVGDSSSRDWTCSTNLVTLDKAIAQVIEAMTADWPQDHQPDPMDGTYGSCLLAAMGSLLDVQKIRKNTRRTRKRRTTRKEKERATRRRRASR
jgi:hypothetical protein